MGEVQRQRDHAERALGAQLRTELLLPQCVKIVGSASLLPSSSVALIISLLGNCSSGRGRKRLSASDSAVQSGGSQEGHLARQVSPAASARQRERAPRALHA